MIVLDVNVLVAAFRQDHPHHSVARPWLIAALEADQPIVVPDSVWVGFVRVVTHPTVFAQPSPIEETSEFIDAVCRAPAFAIVTPPTDAPARLAELCRDSQATGNLVPDAWIAVIALALGAAVATFDRDFRRFDGLRIVTPST